MISNVLASDPIAGYKQILHFDATEDKYILETIHDQEAVLQANKDIRSTFDERAGWKGDMHRVASIPLPLYFQLKYERGLFRGQHLSEADRRWLNNKDNEPFRTRPGRV